MEDEKEACGLIGVVGHKHAAEYAVSGLFALQHRGEEACGVTAASSDKMKSYQGLGHVSRVFHKMNFAPFKGMHMALGHTRYSITGESENLSNIQPFLVKHKKKQFAVAHNGNIVNSLELKQKLENLGAIFQTTSDSEILVHLIVKSQAKTFKQKIIDAAKKIHGSFNFLILTTEKLYAIRDAHGFRPLCYGEFKKKDGSLTRIVCSETCALDLLDAKYMGQVDPGCLLSLDRNGHMTSDKVLETKKPQAKCIFEMIYFARPDSLVFGESVYAFRKKLGRLLAEQAPVDADIVLPVPDSGNYAALGFSAATGIPLELAITRNHYARRSFIQPSQKHRRSTIKVKLNPIKNVISKKRIVLIDDSIVRGNTLFEKIKILREHGVAEVHLRIAAPPVKHPCFYGIDFPSGNELLANKKTLKQIEKFLNVDSLAFISVENLMSCSERNSGFCNACFTGKYPVKIKHSLNKKTLA